MDKLINAIKATAKIYYGERRWASDVYATYVKMHGSVSRATFSSLCTLARNDGTVRLGSKDLFNDCDDTTDGQAMRDKHTASTSVMCDDHYCFVDLA